MNVEATFELESSVERKEHSPLCSIALLAHIVVNSIPAKEAEPWLLEKHYAKRMCPISYAFGAWRGSVLIGVVTYGTPASAPLRGGVCGDEWASSLEVLEIRKLCYEGKTVQRRIAERFKVSPETVYQIKYRKTYRSI